MLPLRESLRVAWRNIPFRFAVGMHMLNWSAVDLLAISFPYFLLYWFAEGDMLATINVFGAQLSLESGFFGVLMMACIACVPFWLWLAHKRNKREAYMLGMGFWVVVQALIFLLQPAQPAALLALAAMAGIGVSAAYVMPDSILPDVIEWDELRTGRRQEGIYYGVRAFIRKLTGALVIFVTLQLLGWSGYQTPPVDALRHAQSAGTLQMIRYLVSPLGAALLIGVIVLAWFYPLSREEHTRIRQLLERRRMTRRL
jgi:GPH family glycoside/pentoside/hexuronide:cation symporter